MEWLSACSPTTFMDVMQLSWGGTAAYSLHSSLSSVILNVLLFRNAFFSQQPSHDILTDSTNPLIRIVLTAIFPTLGKKKTFGGDFFWCLFINLVFILGQESMQATTLKKFKLYLSQGIKKKFKQNSWLYQKEIAKKAAGQSRPPKKKKNPRQAQAETAWLPPARNGVPRLFSKWITLTVFYTSCTI